MTIRLLQLAASDVALRQGGPRARERRVSSVGHNRWSIECANAGGGAPLRCPHAGVVVDCSPCVAKGTTTVRCCRTNVRPPCNQTFCAPIRGNRAQVCMAGAPPFVRHPGATHQPAVVRAVERALPGFCRFVANVLKATLHEGFSTIVKVLSQASDATRQELRSASWARGLAGCFRRMRREGRKSNRCPGGADETHEGAVTALSG